MRQLAALTSLALSLTTAPMPARADDGAWFDDVEKYTRLRDTRMDVAGPEPGSFTTLNVAPFLTAQALASSDIAFSAAQVFDDLGNPRAALGVDFAPIAVSDGHFDLADYQRSHAERFIARIQLSAAVSKGESSADRSTRFAPTLRIVLHEQRDPRVHRGPGSLKDCFERHVTPPTAERQHQADLAARLQSLQRMIDDPASSEAARQQARIDHGEVQAQWKAGQAQYLAVLRQIVETGMKACRDDPQVAAYTWNATGYAIGFSPSFRNHSSGLGELEPKGYVVFGTAAYGFDALGTKSYWVPSFFGRHVQILGGLLYRHDEPLQNPRSPRDFIDAHELAVSARLRGGTSPFNANIEVAYVRDWFDDAANDSYYKLAVGPDLHVAEGTWISASIGRTFWRGAIDNETSFGLSIKRSLLN